MYNNNFLTNEQINDHLAEVLDAFLSTDKKYQALVTSRHKAADVVAALHLPILQWQAVDDYVSAIYECFVAYATAAYRLGFQDGIGSNPSMLNAACLGITNLILDTLEKNITPISWQPSNRPEIARTITNLLANFMKGD